MAIFYSPVYGVPIMIPARADLLLPDLNNPAGADQIVEGYDALNGVGELVTGINPYEKEATDAEVATQAGLLAQLQQAVVGKDPRGMLMVSATASNSGYGLGIGATATVTLPEGATIVKVLEHTETYSVVSFAGYQPYGTPTIAVAEDYTVGEDGSVSLARSRSTGSNLIRRYNGVRVTIIVLYRV